MLLYIISLNHAHSPPLHALRYLATVLILHSPLTQVQATMSVHAPLHRIGPGKLMSFMYVHLPFHAAAQGHRDGPYPLFPSQPGSSSDERRHTAASRRSGKANAICVRSPHPPCDQRPHDCCYSPSCFQPGTDKHDGLRSLAPQSAVQTNVDASSSGPSSSIHSYSSIDRQFSQFGHNQMLPSPLRRPLDLEDTESSPQQQGEAD
jgi:hypothetical protein